MPASPPQAFTALAARNINIRAITTSEIKFSVLIDAAYTELAVRTLHTLYGLDQGLERFSPPFAPGLIARPPAFWLAIRFATQHR